MKSYHAGLVSIIMPAYNCQKYISQAIESIVNQTYNNWELLICDDCSTDGTYQIAMNYARKFSRIKAFRNNRNLRQTITKNFLIERSYGEFITFQDGDDWSHCRRIELLVNEFRRNSRLGLLSSQIVYVNKIGNPIRNSNKPTSYEEVLSLIHKYNVIGGPGMMIRRESLISPFRDFFIANEDYDLSYLIAEKFESYSLTSYLYFYRVLDKSISNEISLDRLLSNLLVRHLGQQRKDRGTDDLMDNDQYSIQEYTEKVKKPYFLDSSLIYREYAANFMYKHLYKKAISTSWKAIKKRPTKWVNWMTLQYCVRKTILSFFGHGF